MNNQYFEINDKLLEANRVANKFIRGKRFFLAFSLDTDILVNDTIYRKIRAMDINIDNGEIILSKKKDNSNVKVKVPVFSFATIDYLDGGVRVDTK